MIGWIAGSAALGLALWYWHERRNRRTHPMSGGLHADISLPHSAELELYHSDFSLCSGR